MSINGTQVTEPHCICRRFKETWRLQDYRSSIIHADVNCRDKIDWNTLHVASLNGRHDIVELLPDHGADFNTRNQELRTPLHVASWNGHLEVVRVLFE